MKTVVGVLNHANDSAIDWSRELTTNKVLRFHLYREIFLMVLAGWSAYGLFCGVAGIGRFLARRVSQHRCNRRRALLQNEADSFAKAVHALQNSPSWDERAYGKAVADFESARRRIDSELSVSGAWRLRRDKAWAEWMDGMDGRLKRLGMPDGALPPPPKVSPGGPSPFPYLRRGAPIRRLCQWSVSKPPTGEELLKQWERARGHGKTEEKIRLGSMLLDIEATVDSSLVRNRDGEIIGRNAGVKGWLKTNCGQLVKRYAMLMSCRRLACEFRKAGCVGDPIPAAALLPGSTPPEMPERYRERLEAARKDAAAMLAGKEARHAKTFLAFLPKAAEENRRKRKLPQADPLARAEGA